MMKDRWIWYSVAPVLIWLLLAGCATGPGYYYRNLSLFSPSGLSGPYETLELCQQGLDGARIAALLFGGVYPKSGSCQWQNPDVK